MNNRNIFHLALNVTDLDLAARFYIDLLGAKPARKSASWIDFDFFGHQLSLHLGKPLVTELTGQVDGVAVPMPHFGIVLPKAQWQQLAEKLQQKEMEFIIPPTVRFASQQGEQFTLFFMDPFGNPIEIKSFEDMSGVFTV